VEFALPNLLLGPVSEPTIQAETIVQGGPGKYRVSYHVYYLNADNTGNFLPTGEVNVDVLQSQERKP
jgi:hypothetical protein